MAALAFVFHSAAIRVDVHGNQIAAAAAWAAFERGNAVSTADGFKLLVGEFYAFFFGVCQHFIMVFARLDLGDLLFG